jgi:thiamine-phosphate pyrophosphorylase
VKALAPLYAICDAEVCERIRVPIVDLAAAYLQGGVRLLQIRGKTAGSAWVAQAAQAIVDLGRAAGATVIVNDRADIARIVGADGVHLGQEDLAPSAVRRILGAGAILGFSTHTVAQLHAATAEPVDYVAIGPVFSTGTKATGYDAVGLDMVRRARRIADAAGLPLVAIGGITLETAPDVVAAGAHSVAVITDLAAGGDPAARARAYVDRLGG